MFKLENFIKSRTEGVLGLRNQLMLKQFFDASSKFYKKPAQKRLENQKKRSKIEKNNLREGR